MYIVEICFKIFNVKIFIKLIQNVNKIYSKIILYILYIVSIHLLQTLEARKKEYPKPEK